MPPQPTVVALPTRAQGVFISDDDEVLVRGRVRKVYPEQGIAIVRYPLAGGPGFKQEIVALSNIAYILHRRGDGSPLPAPPMKE